jgi:hypothetical protein
MLTFVETGPFPVILVSPTPEMAHRTSCFSNKSSSISTESSLRSFELLLSSFFRKDRQSFPALY